MNDFLREMGLSVTIGIMLITIIDLILPDSNTKKYISLISGLLIVLLIFAPVVKLLKSENFNFDDIKTDYKTRDAFDIKDENKSYSRYFFDAYNDETKNSN